LSLDCGRGRGLSYAKRQDFKWGLRFVVVVLDVLIVDDSQIVVVIS